MAGKIGAIITGGDSQALSAMRSLAKKGIPVILLDSDSCIGRYSRYRTKFYKSPKISQTELYLKFLINLEKRYDVHGWVIIPNSDEAVFFLSKNKCILEKHFRIPTTHWDVIQNVYIKKNTYQLAEKNGISIPKTYYPTNLKELLALNLKFPVIIKPSIRDHFYNKTKKKHISYIAKKIY